MAKRVARAKSGAADEDISAVSTHVRCGVNAPKDEQRPCWHHTSLTVTFIAHATGGRKLLHGTDQDHTEQLRKMQGNVRDLTERYIPLVLLEKGELSRGWMKESWAIHRAPFPNFSENKPGERPYINSS